MVFFIDFILYEYGGWEKFFNYIEEISVLECYIKVSIFIFCGEK